MIDFSHSPLWDHAAVDAIAKVIAKDHRFSKSAKLIRLDAESRALLRLRSRLEHAYRAADSSGAATGVSF